VADFWIMRDPGPDAMSDGHRIFPDGFMEFVFQLGEPFQQRQADGEWRQQAAELLVGQMERFVDVRPTGAIHTVGIHFRPAGLAAFVAGDLSRFRNQILSLGAALESDLGPLLRDLRSARTPAATAASLERFLRQRQHPADLTMTRAAQQLLEHSGSADLGNLACQSDLSPRQFRRRFLATVGIGPRRFSRIVRFQRVFDEGQQHDGVVWTQVAHDCGFYDQAHFNRDFRSFTGLRPRDIIRDMDPLTEFFLSVSSKSVRSQLR
jgi:AraC-like DNA-binding protein